MPYIQNWMAHARETEGLKSILLVDLSALRALELEGYPSKSASFLVGRRARRGDACTRRQLQLSLPSISCVCVAQSEGSMQWLRRARKLLFGAVA